MFFRLNVLRFRLNENRKIQMVMQIKLKLKVHRVLKTNIDFFSLYLWTIKKLVQLIQSLAFEAIRFRPNVSCVLRLRMWPVHRRLSSANWPLTSLGELHEDCNTIIVYNTYSLKDPNEVRWAARVIQNTVLSTMYSKVPTLKLSLNPRILGRALLEALRGPLSITKSTNKIKFAMWGSHFSELAEQSSAYKCGCIQLCSRSHVRSSRGSQLLFIEL